MEQSPFNQNVVIITGASSGIGAALAHELSGQGAWLVLAARRADRLEEVVQACRERGAAAGARILAHPADVADSQQCRALVEHSVATYGRLDTLVNNAGITMWAPFEALPDPHVLEQIMRVNYLGSVYCTMAALPHLKHSRGRLVAVASLAGRTGVPLRSGYAASKHALVGFFESLRIELAPAGVSVTLIFPDFVATETHQRAFGADGQPLGRSPVQAGKVMTAEECARRIVRAAAVRRRQEIMSLRGNIGQWLKLLFPRMVDAIARRAIARGR